MRKDPAGAEVRRCGADGIGFEVARRLPAPVSRARTTDEGLAQRASRRRSLARIWPVVAAAVVLIASRRSPSRVETLRELEPRTRRAPRLHRVNRIAVERAVRGEHCSRANHAEQAASAVTGLAASLEVDGAIDSGLAKEIRDGVSKAMEHRRAR
jgi:hypothetical protein